MEDRARVVYDNHVDPDALRTMTVRKKIVDETGRQEIPHSQDDTEFNFRLYLAAEFEELEAASMHSYHVRNEEGFYCRWSVADQKLIPTEYSTLDGLSDEQKNELTFHSSINGAITRIPNEYTIEIRDVLAGTQFRIVERPSEMPDGYSFQKYEYEGYTPGGDDPDTIASAGVTDTVSYGKDPAVTVWNYKGWGIRVNKVWTDKDYMTDREPVYFAVYTHTDEDSDLVLVEDSIRQMPYNNTTLYWYYKPLPKQGETEIPFNNFEIREVRVKNPVVNDEGHVTGYDSIEIINNGDDVILNGTQKGETQPADFTYSVIYEKGEVPEFSNVRTDTVTNSRKGVLLKKTDWAGNALPGAVFRIEENDGTLIGTFTSDSNGLITEAFLGEDKDYKLTETRTPKGAPYYHGPDEPLTIRIEDNTLTVNGSTDNGEYYTIQQAADTDAPQATLTIRNRKMLFRAVKKDRDTEDPLAGVKFDLYEQKSVDGTVLFVAMPDYAGLTTGSDGSIPKITEALPPGTYQLRETSAPSGYQKLSAYVEFSISNTGAITKHGTFPQEASLESEKNEETGEISYLLTILNTRDRAVRFIKVDAADTSTVLAGARFDLYDVVDGRQAGNPRISGLVSNSDGVLCKGSDKVFNLPVGQYYLVETKAPDGYKMRTSPVIIDVTADAGPYGVSYDDGTVYSQGGSGKSYDEQSKVYTLRITNSAGAALPSTGGPGTTLVYVLGAVLVIASGAGIAVRRRLKCGRNK